MGQCDIGLRLIKLIHTLIWLVFACAIVAIPVFAMRNELQTAWWLIGFVLLEVLVLLANRMRCPLTDVAGRYTSARDDNFDIYLPRWLARHNKLIFGGLYLAAIALTTWLQVDAVG